MKKLIRDNIPEIALTEGRILPTYIEHSDETYFQMLKNKLVEEAAEVLESDKSGTVEELADVLTVVYAIVKHMDCEDALFEVAEEKLKEKGGFYKRIVLTK